METQIMAVFAQTEFTVPLGPGDAGAALHMELVTDVNGDGLPDIVFIPANFAVNPSGIQIKFLINDGQGSFADETSSFFPDGIPTVIFPRSAIVGDFNGDGRPDIFIAESGEDRPPFPGAQNRLLLSSGLHGFEDASNLLPQENSRADGDSVAADFNGDGFTDILVMNVNSGVETPGSYFLINDGTGHFSKNTDLLPSYIANRDVIFPAAAALDVNGDGHPLSWARGLASTRR